MAYDGCEGRLSMTELLENALASEAHWRQAFANSEDKLAQLADEALEEFRAGKTTPLDEGLG
jgi:hypothetical protein